MKKRLNDTSALVDSPQGEGVSHTVSTRRIGNGFVTRTSSCNERTGEYRSDEVFSANAPKIIPPKVGRGPSPDSGSALGGAVRYLKDGV